MRLKVKIGANLYRVYIHVSNLYGKEKCGRKQELSSVYTDGRILKKIQPV